MNEPVKPSQNTDFQNNSTETIYIKAEELPEKTEKIDYSKVYELPPIKVRYFSMLIDGICILVFSFALAMLFDKIGEVPDYVRGICFVLVVLLYEPILVSLGSTIGQLVMDIRVRSFQDPEKKLNFFLVIVRVSFKLILGWLSFLTVTFNTNRRAIHDFMSGSIVVAKKIATK
jgi:uncharacterized RDD family membrane protein YckC